jgi:ferredoxin
MLYINPDECVSCDLCVAECPVNAIFNEDDIPEKWKHFIDINKNFFKPKPTGEQQPAK